MIKDIVAANESVAGLNMRLIIENEDAIMECML